MRAACLACLLLLAAAPPAAAAGEDGAGRYIVHWFNGDGVEVYFDGEHKGTIADTELVVAVDPGAPPAREYTVQKGERLMYTGFIERAPAAGETIDLFPQHYQVEQPAPGAEVNETGWYLIYRADGEAVYFDEFVGVVEGGALRVAVNTTLLPPKEFVCYGEDGWTMSRHQLPPPPPPGGTVHVYTLVQSAPHFSASVTPGTSSLPTEAAATPLPGFGAAGAVVGLLIAAAGRLRMR